MSIYQNNCGDKGQNAGTIEYRSKTDSENID